MSVKIRLQRRGTTNTAFYRIVVADSRSRRDGRFIEELGFYDPLKRPAVVKVDRAAAFRWMRNGAILSDTVESIFSKVGILSDWHRMRAGESVNESGAEEMRIFQHKASATRPSKKAKAKSAKKAEEKPAAEGASQEG